MPPEILTDFSGMCCKSQDISCGIMELAKIRYEFGSRIACGGFPTGWMSGDGAIRDYAKEFAS
jgi:hypothetical protein